MATSTAGAAAQQKFSNVRRRLDQLGYKQTLGIESLPLVEKLFADLIHTTESLKNAKLDLSKKVRILLIKLFLKSCRFCKKKISKPAGSPCFEKCGFD